MASVAGEVNALTQMGCVSARFTEGSFVFSWVGSYTQVCGEDLIVNVIYEEAFTIKHCLLEAIISKQCEGQRSDLFNFKALHEASRIEQQEKS